MIEAKKQTTLEKECLQYVLRGDGSRALTNELLNWWGHTWRNTDTEFPKFYWPFLMEDTRFFIEYWGKLFPGLLQRVWAGHCFEMCVALCLFSLEQISQQEPDLLGFPYLPRGKEILSSNSHHPARQEKWTSHCSTWELSLHSWEEELFRGNCVMYTPESYTH